MLSIHFSFKHVNLSMLICFLLIKKERNKLPTLREMAVLMPTYYLTDLNLLTMIMMHYQDGPTVDAA